MSREPKQITELWAWIVREPDGGEGVPAMTLPIAGSNQLAPMMGADEERIRSLEPYARRIAKMGGLPLKLVRFSQAEIIEAFP